jgi:two-component system response regulator RegA
VYDSFVLDSASSTDKERGLILVVDDDPVLRQRLARAFVDRGYSVSQAGSYDEAMREAHSAPPRYAVLDLKMPGRSGLELARDLRAEHDDLKILILTGYGSIATAIESMRLGATHYLSKPADADEILAGLERDPTREESAADFKAPSLARAEWEHINRVLEDSAGNISEAARRLGMHRRSLQRKLQKYPPKD